MEGGADQRRPYQAPVSFRIVPRILGRSIRARDAAEHAAEVFAHKPDWITFGSSSAVKNLLDAAGPALFQGGLGGVRIASIGPVTSGTIRQYGFEVDAEAAPYTMEGMIAALCRAAAKTAEAK